MPNKRLNLIGHTMFMLLLLRVPEMVISRLQEERIKFLRKKTKMIK